MTRTKPASFPCTGRIAMTFALSLAAISPAAFAADAADRLGLPPSPASTEYVQQRTQFQLHTLLTEQRHPKTWNLSEAAASNPAQALSQLFSVDEDVARAFAALADDPQRMAQLHAASAAVQRALRDGHRIYFYGTGSTGRLAETLESGIWRSFWLRMQADPAWPRIAAKLPENLGERVRGEITGGDRALISSLEGFEDLQLIGALQLRDDGIGRDDVVFAVTEGGETSAVIGTALAAADQRGAGTDRVWFVYNNPDEVLRPFERSRRVLDDARIGKIPLPTGPQAITGSTRMQATTTSLYALGLVLEDALRALLLPQLSVADAQRLGLDARDSIEGRLRDFAQLQRTVAASAPQLAQWTEREARAYAQGRHATYLAGAVAMYREELDEDPLVTNDVGYRRYVRSLIDTRRAFALREDDEVVFKADLGAVTATVAQVQGVWVAPRLRGRGLSVPAMAAVTNAIVEEGRIASLYVNDFNTPAVSCYRSCGYAVVDELASVLY